MVAGVFGKRPLASASIDLFHRALFLAARVCDAWAGKRTIAYGGRGGSMKDRKIHAGARLLGGCALALLASAAVTACSGGSSTTAPTIPSVSVSGSGSVTFPTTTATGTAPSTSATGRTTHTATPTATATHGPTPSANPSSTVFNTPGTAPAATPTSSSASPVPSGAPAAGGGGTAGLQDALLLELGGAAVLAGAGSLLYRRRLVRKR
jgi:hypothetical protein